MKKNVIVITGHELTPEERKNYSKDHPGSRLCFRLRFPNFPLYVQSIVLVIEIILIIQKGVTKMYEILKQLREIKNLLRKIAENTEQIHCITLENENKTSKKKKFNFR